MKNTWRDFPMISLSQQFLRQFSYYFQIFEGKASSAKSMLLALKLSIRILQFCLPTPKKAERVASVVVR
ncbi:MAG: hypothetical protein LM522_00910 [Candidatus Contendobacter sp.]|nr:hypothetical protein [Candidatus Contendobacter sp.]